MEAAVLEAEGQDPLPDDPGVVSPGGELLADVAPLVEVDPVEIVQVELEGRHLGHAQLRHPLRHPELAAEAGEVGLVHQLGLRGHVGGDVRTLEVLLITAQSLRWCRVVNRSIGHFHWLLVMVNMKRRSRILLRHLAMSQ